MTISVAFLVWRHPSPNEFVWNNRSSIFIKKWQHYHAPWLLICNKLTNLFIAIQFNCCPQKNWQTKINSWMWHELCFALLTYSFHFTNNFWNMIFSLNLKDKSRNRKIWQTQKKNRQNDLSYARLCLHTVFISRVFLKERIWQKNAGFSCVNFC